MLYLVSKGQKKDAEVQKPAEGTGAWVDAARLQNLVNQGIVSRAQADIVSGVNAIAAKTGNTQLRNWSMNQLLWTKDPYEHTQAMAILSTL